MSINSVIGHPAPFHGRTWPHDRRRNRSPPAFWRSMPFRRARGHQPCMGC